MSQPSLQPQTFPFHAVPSVAANTEDAAMLTLDGRGMIRDCNRAGEKLFKYRRTELVWRDISMLFPELAKLQLMQHGQPNPRLRFFCRIGFHFQAVTKDGAPIASELCLNLLDNTGYGRLSLIVRPLDAHHPHEAAQRCG